MASEVTDHFEHQRKQLIVHLGQVAESMRKCATIAEQFAQMAAQIPNSLNGDSSLHAAPNSQVSAEGKPSAKTPAPTGKRKVVADTVDDGEVKKKRRVVAKKPRDPNAPKRPASSYIMFQNEIRKALKKDNPSIPNNELLATISKQWGGMTEEQKAVYNRAASDAKAKWTDEKAAYDAKTSQGVVNSPTDPVDSSLAPAKALAVKKVKAPAKATAPTHPKPQSKANQSKPPQPKPTLVVASSSDDSSEESEGDDSSIKGGDAEEEDDDDDDDEGESDSDEAAEEKEVVTKLAPGSKPRPPKKS